MGCMLNSRDYFCIPSLPLQDQPAYTPGAEFQQCDNLFRLHPIDSQFHHCSAFHIDEIQSSKIFQLRRVDSIHSGLLIWDSDAHQSHLDNQYDRRIYGLNQCNDCLIRHK